MAQTNGFAGPRATRGAALLLGLSLSFAAATGSAQADKVGVAAAVNPDAFSSLSGTPDQQLNIGKSIFYNERINTTASGLVQVLLIDGSTFTVGPNSDLVIDKFVYDPRKKTGEMVATFSKGTMRFIGGKLSKNEGGVKVNTPSGALAIRGGMFDARVSGSKSLFAFRYGVSLTFTGNNGARKEVFEQGYVLDLTGNSVIVREGTPEDTQLFQSAFSGGGTTVVPGQDTQPTNQALLTETISLQELISDATAERINNDLEQEETQSPPPKQVTFRVLTTPGVYDAYGERFEANNSGILGGGTYPDGTPAPLTDDFTWTFSIVNGRFVGTVIGLTDANCSDSNCDIIQTKTLSSAKVDFPASFPAAKCTNGVCPVTNAKVTQNGVTTNYVGIAVLKQDFFAYQVFAGTIQNGTLVIADPDEPDPILLIGGTGHKFDAPSGKVYTFALSPDILQSEAAGPFASSNSSPEGGIQNVSPLVLVEQDTGGAEDASRAVWLQTSFVVGQDDSPSFGQSFINIALGEWSVAGGLDGSRRGGSAVDDNYSFSGDIASLAGPDGSHFLGKDSPNLVVGFDSTGSHNIGRDTPLNPEEGINDTVQNQIGSTYHIGTSIGKEGPLQQTTGTFNGFAAGFLQQPGGGSPDTLINTSPKGVEIALDSVTNTMTASINVGNVGDVGNPIDLAAELLGVLPNPRYELEFGGQGNSAFIDDGIFAAFEKPGASTIEQTVLVPHQQWAWHWRYGWYQRTVYYPGNRTYTPDIQSYIVSADAIAANEVLFNGQKVEGPDGLVQKRAFCQDCDYIKWGAWGMRANYENHAGHDVTDDVHLGWWIAGDVLSKGEMNAVAVNSANYKGDAIGTVATAGKQYVATGGMDMTWYFQSRVGTMNITNFDGKNFTAGMTANKATPQQFNGAMVGPGMVGKVNGAFVGPNGTAAPKGVIGNFSVGNSAWKANGILGGIKQ